MRKHEIWHYPMALTAIVCLILVGSTSFLVADDLSVEECDRYAADPNDAERTSEGVPIDILNAPMAINACQRALERSAHHPRIEYQLGRALKKIERHDEAFLEILGAAEKGYVAAQMEVGRLYELGRGVDQDFEQALKWYEDAADNGHLGGIASSAALYLFGHGVDPDPARALMMFRQAATAGHVESQYALGSFHREGMHAKRDYQEAIKWFQNAADQGYAPAMLALATMTAMGQGFEKNYEAAAEWLKKGAEANDAEAITRLGDAYAHGRGVPKDEDKAIEFYQRAAGLGSLLAKHRLERLGQR